MKVGRVVAVWFLVLCQAAWSEGLVRISGEDTMIYIAQQCSRVYQRSHAGESTQFEIVGGNREKAAAALLNHQTDILQTKAPLAAALAGHSERVTRVPIGVESAVVYVNPANPVTELSMEELREVFTGKIANWRQLGGADRPIHLFAGESTTGLEEFFEHMVLRGEEPAPFWGKSTAKALVDAVSADADAIGYASYYFSYAVRALSIRGAKGEKAVEPTPNNLRNRNYPITRFLYWYLPADARPPVRAFAQWMFSSNGQIAIESVGYMPLPPNERASALAAIARP